MTTENQICVRIKGIRLRRNYTQHYMGKKLGYDSTKSYARIENGACKMTITQLAHIAILLKVKLTELVDLETPIEIILHRQFLLDAPPRKNLRINTKQAIACKTLKEKITF